MIEVPLAFDRRNPFFKILRSIVAPYTIRSLARSWLLYHSLLT